MRVPRAGRASGGGGGYGPGGGRRGGHAAEHRAGAYAGAARPHQGPRAAGTPSIAICRPPFLFQRPY